MRIGRPSKIRSETTGFPRRRAHSGGFPNRQAKLRPDAHTASALDMTKWPIPHPMQLALDAARAAGAQGEVPIGAVVMKGDEVLSVAANRTRTPPDPTGHAEIVALREAAVKLGSERLTDCDLYVTLEPCAMCAGAISHARIGKLYYAASDPKGGAVEHGARVFEHPQALHRPEVYSGVGETEAAEILRDFFKARR
jgi:tRNA(adenine34) deaminase